MSSTKVIGFSLIILLGLIGSAGWFVKGQASDADLTKLLEDPYHGYEANEVINKSPIELLNLRGYETENHYATTKDGSKINVVRIVNKALPQGFKLRRPVLFNHGPFNSATIWLINSRDFKPMDFSQDRCNFNATTPSSSKAKLANTTSNDGFDRYLNGPMMLSNAGHDVWVMSMRGTEFSQNNTKLDSSDPEIWNFSYDDVVAIDLPTVIRYIKNKTKSSKLGYVGHSLAGFAVLALLSKKPGYADTIEPVVLVNPGLYFGHMTSSLRGALLEETSEPETDQGPLPPNADQVRDTLTKTCTGFEGATTCTFAYAHAFGLGKHWPPGYFSHISYEFSRKMARHIGQMVLSNQFQMYDYNSTGNMLHYNQPTPPKYPIENIRSKSLCLFTAKADAYSVPRDVKKFEMQLKVASMRNVKIGVGYNYFDLITSQDSGQVLFRKVLDIFNSFDGICS